MWLCMCKCMQEGKFLSACLRLCSPCIGHTCAQACARKCTRMRMRPQGNAYVYPYIREHVYASCRRTPRASTDTVCIRPYLHTMVRTYPHALRALFVGTHTTIVYKACWERTVNGCVVYLAMDNTSQKRQTFLVCYAGLGKEEKNAVFSIMFRLFHW